MPYIRTAVTRPHSLHKPLGPQIKCILCWRQGSLGRMTVSARVLRVLSVVPFPGPGGGATRGGWSLPEYIVSKLKNTRNWVGNAFIFLMVGWAQKPPQKNYIALISIQHASYVWALKWLLKMFSSFWESLCPQFSISNAECCISTYSSLCLYATSTYNA